jgi:hypothetical protein
MIRFSFFYLKFSFGTCLEANEIENKELVISKLEIDFFLHSFALYLFLSFDVYRWDLKCWNICVELKDQKLKFSIDTWRHYKFFNKQMIHYRPLLFLYRMENLKSILLQIMLFIRIMETTEATKIITFLSYW